MSDRRPNGCIGFGRRAFVTSLASFTLAGCGEATREHPSTLTPDPDVSRDGTFETVRTDVESLFASLAELPVSEGGEFVFDMRTFEEEFDHEALLETAENAIERLRTPEFTGVEKARIENLRLLGQTARLLIGQRILVHQVIASGLAFQVQFSETKYDEASTAIRDGQGFLEDLVSTGNRIEDTLSKTEKIDLNIDEYDFTFIKNTQDVLIEISLWTNTAYEGLHHVVSGLREFQRANGKLDEMDYKGAQMKYQASNERFEKAVSAFDSAQGRGERLPQMASVVDGIRCTIPAYLEASSRLQTSMGAFESGEESRGREIAREAFELADEKMAQCL